MIIIAPAQSPNPKDDSSQDGRFFFTPFYSGIKAVIK